MKIRIVKEFQETSEVFVSPEHKSSGFQCFNVVIGNASKSDLHLFFGPISNETFLSLTDTQWATLLKTLGIFPSSGQARKNGWDKKIPLGWSEASFKKQRRVVFVLRVPPSWWTQIKEKLWVGVKGFLDATLKHLTDLRRPKEMK